MMTKVLYGQKKRDSVSCILYAIWDHEDEPESTKEWFFACLYAMTKTTTEPVCMYFTFSKSTSIKDKYLEGTDKYSHNTLMSVRTTGWRKLYHRKIPLLHFQKSKQIAVRVTENVGAYLARAHALWLITEWPAWWMLFDCNNAMLGGITSWEFDLLKTDLRNNY